MSNSFNKEVLVELLKKSLNSEELLKKHFEEWKETLFSYNESLYSANKSSITYHAIEPKDTTSDDMYYLRHTIYKKFNLSDSYEKSTHMPKHIKINFEGEPALILNYSAIEEKTVKAFEYTVPFFWIGLRTGIKKLTIEAVNRTYVDSYTLTHGRVKTTLTAEEVDKIFNDFHLKIEAYAHKYDLNKAMKRLNDLNKKN